MQPVPKANSRRKPSHQVIYYTLMSSPFGPIGIASTPRGICRISLNANNEPAFRKKLERDYRCSAVRQDRHFAELGAGMRTYFSGSPVRFGGKIDLLEGTPFQKKVWRFLQRIPFGQTRSYQTVARAIGHPNSFRAVGGACGNNPIAVLIPCHRVINADGKLGGYTGGLQIKRRLLSIERTDRFRG